MPIATGFPLDGIFEDECHEGRTETVRSTCSPFASGFPSDSIFEGEYHKGRTGIHAVAGQAGPIYLPSTSRAPSLWFAN